MRRRLLIIAVCLLLGAVVNVAVWWIPTWEYAPGPATEPLSEQDSQEIWSKYARPGWPSGPGSGHRTIGLLWTYDILQDGPDPPSTKYQIVQVDNGWPLRSLRGVSLLDPSLTFPRTVRFLGFNLRPIIPGFIVNTLFYAAMLGLLIQGFISARRYRRIRRNLCPTCPSS